MHIFRLVMLMLAPLFLTACVTAGANTQANTGAGFSKSELDATIGKYSQQLADQCFALKTAVTTAQVFVKSKTAQQALDAGAIALNDFCTAPPQNTNQAIAQVAGIAIKINEAIKIAKAEKKAS